MLRAIKNKVTAFLLIFLMLSFVSPHAAFAKEVDSKKEKVVSNVAKGQKAPYEGVLFTILLAAEIGENCDPANMKKKCDILTTAAVSLASNECTKTVTVLTATNKAQEEKYSAIVSAKDEEIQRLRDISKPAAWFESPYLWGSVGFLLGGTGVYLIAKNVK